MRGRQPRWAAARRRANNGTPLQGGRLAGSGAGDDRPTSFGDTLSGGWHAFLTAVRWVLVAVGAVLPFAVAAGLVYALWRLVRDRLPGTRRRRRTAGGPAPQPADGAADAPGAAAPAEASETAAEGDREPR
ncbi:DUF4349 domain-containing protein [Streptomyces platensis]